ncbi:MAG: hypothetical protein FJ264_15835 [Planctomycetes bacterium]|nr:hypothetical protein [Planctomycetota bacterium]MBM4066126.1 hypothetical protein [Planctomycetota bacterium]
MKNDLIPKKVAGNIFFRLNEFAFRFNRRTSKSRGKLFFRLLQQAVAIDPFMGNTLFRSLQYVVCSPVKCIGN